MISQLDILKKRMAAEQISNIKIFRGTAKNVTAQQIAGEINKSLDDVEKGDFDNDVEID